MTPTAPPCPECGGARHWYGSVELWVGGTSHRADDNLNAAVCGNCGYSGLYLQNMPGFRQALAAMGAAPAGEDLGDAPGMLADGPRDRSEGKAFRKAVRNQKKSGSA
jgi:predicted nucleic-acid-binding Zn-ribbon protein